MTRLLIGLAHPAYCFAFGERTRIDGRAKRARKIHKHDVNIVASPVLTREMSPPTRIRYSLCADVPMTTKIAPVANIVMPAAESPSEIRDRFFMRKPSSVDGMSAHFL